MQGRSTLATVLIVIGAVVVAWWLVGFVFQAIAFIGRLVVVAVIALVIYVLVRRALSSKDE
ncbi:MAG: hypothetical protein ACTHXO_03355 [Actinomycetaceae bacterium]